MIRKSGPVLLSLAAASLVVLVVGCQKSSNDSELTDKDFADVQAILADTVGSLGVIERPQPLPPRMTFSAADIPKEGGYLQVSIGNITDESANKFMRRLKSEPCTCSCSHTIDQCLIEDPQCDVAHDLAAQVLRETTGNF